MRSIRSLKRFIFLSLALLVLSVSTSSAAILTVSGGQLVGAKQVVVGDYYYDVEFVEGTCDGLFNKCSDFDFGLPNEDELLDLAVEALLIHVFIDVEGVGNFDSVPTLTRGCTLQGACGVLTPYSYVGTTLFFALTLNYPIIGDQVIYTSFDDIASTPTNTFGNLVYAKWTRVSAVPIPAAIWLFGTALIGLVGFGKRRAAVSA